MATHCGQRILECCRIIIKRQVVVKMQNAQETKRSRVTADFEETGSVDMHHSQGAT